MAKDNTKILNSLNESIKKFGSKSANNTTSPSNPTDDRVLTALVGIFSLLSGEKKSIEDIAVFDPKNTVFGLLNQNLQNMAKMFKPDYIETTFFGNTSYNFLTKVISVGVQDANKDLIKFLEEKLQSLAEVISDNKAASAFKLKGGSIVNIRKTSGDLDIFDVLSKISEINDYELQHKCAVLSDIVSDQLKPIIDEINNTKLPNEKNLKKLTLLFETISKTLDNLPSLFSLMKSTLSVGALNTLIIPNLIEISNELKKIRINKTELSKVNDFVSMIGNQINLLLELIGNSKETYQNANKTMETVMFESVQNLQKLANDLLTLDKIIKKPLKFQTIKDSIEELQKVPFDDIPNTKELGNIISISKFLNEFIKNLPEDFEEERSKNVRQVVYALGEMLEYFTKDGIIGKMIPNVVSLGKDDAKNVNAIIDYVNELDKLSKKLVVIGTVKEPVLIGAQAVADVVDKMKTVIDSINSTKIDEKKLKLMNESVNQLLKVIVASAAVLLLGAFIMKFIDIKNLISFGLVLGAFVMGITWAYLRNSKSIKESLGIGKNLGILVAVSGVVLLFAGMLANNKILLNALIFAPILALFIAGVTLAVIPASKYLRRSLDSLKDLSVFVVAAGLTMILAGYFTSQINIGKLALFALILSAFTFATLTAIFGAIFLAGKIFGLQGNNIYSIMQGFMAGLREVGIFITLAGLTLILGSHILDFVDIGKAFLFGTVLAGFIFLVSLPFALFKSSSKVVFEGAKQFGLLMVVSTAVLFLGGTLFTAFPELIPGIALFGAVLGGFIALVSLPFLIFGSIKDKIWPSILAVTLMVAVSGTLLLVAGTIMEKNPNMKENVYHFALANFILIGGMSGIAYLLSLAKNNLIKGILGLGAIVLITIGSTYVIEMISDLYNKYDFELIQKAVGTLLLMMGELGLGYILMGYASFLDGGVGLGLAAASMGIISGITLLTSYTMERVMTATNKYDKKKFEIFKEIINEFAELGKSIVSNFSPVGGLTHGANLWVFQLPLIGDTISTLSGAISKISEAVKDYADLRTPIYQGTKIVGYRSLKKKDFKEAGTNVTLIINTLGEAVAKAYEKHPDYYKGGAGGWFSNGSPFAQTVSSNITLAKLLTNIARAVKDYANLMVCDYEVDPKSKKLIPKNPRQLEKSDFKKAGENVALIISTLGEAIVQAYMAHPEYYEGGSGGWFGSGSPFAQTVSSNITLARLLTSIARAVKDYANLNVCDYKVDPDSKKIIAENVRHLDRNDFQKAAENVTLIISTLGGAIIQAYEDHKEYYEDDNWFSSNNPFKRTISSNMRLADLITKIAGAVKDYANLTVAEKYIWDPEKKTMIAHNMRNLTPQDFTDATKNVTTIISVLGGAIINAYKEHPEYYEDDNWFSSDNPFKRTISSNMKLADLISKISQAVKDYANFTVSKYTVKNGEVIINEIDNLKNQDFVDASNNIKTVLETLGGAIMETYKDHSDWFDEEGWFSGDNKFKRVIGSNLKLADLITKIATGVKEYANLTYTEYGLDKDNKLVPKKIHNMNEMDFSKAAENIKSVITTLGKSIIETYNDPKYKAWFDDGENSDFAQACAAIGSMGNMITNIAQGIQQYADMKFPEYNGTEITKYKEITVTELTNASNNIGIVISTVGKSLIDFYETYPEYFNSGEDSVLNIVTNATAQMGDTIGSIAQAIGEYAQLNIPISWDSNGNPIDYKQLKDTDIELASTNISKIISTLGLTFIALRNGGVVNFSNPNKPTIDPDDQLKQLAREMFNENKDGTIFSRVVESCAYIGDVISSIAEGVAMYASSTYKLPDGSVKSLYDFDFETAGANIGKVITTIGGAIMKAFSNNTEMFTVPTIGESSLSFAGLIKLSFGKKEQKTTGTPFEQVMNSVGKMGGIISSIAQGVSQLASSKVQVYENEKWVDKPIDKTVAKKAAETIGIVITTLSNAIITQYKKNQSLFDLEDVETSELGVHGLFGMGIDNKNTKKGSSPFERVVNSVSKIANIISIVSSAVIKFAGSQVPYYDEKTKQTKYKLLTQTDITAAGTTITTIITTVMEALKNASNSPLFSDQNYAKTVSQVFGGVSGIIGNISKVVVQFATGNFPSKFDPKTGLPIDYQPLSNTDLKNAGTKIGILLTSIIKGILESELFTNKKYLKAFGVKSQEEFFNKYGGKDAPKSPMWYIINWISQVTKPIATLAKVIQGLAGNEVREIITNADGSTKTTITKITKEDIEAAKGTVETLLTGFVGSLNTIWDKHHPLFEKNKDNKSTIESMSEGVQTSVEIIKKIVEFARLTQNEYASVIKGYTENDFNTIQNIIESFKTTVEKLNTLKYALYPYADNTLKDVQNALNTGWNTNMNDTHSVKSFVAYVTEYINVIDQILQLVGRHENPSKEDYEIIGDGIKYISDKISQLGDTKQIENFNTELSKYLTTIDIVKTTVEKLNSLKYALSPSVSTTLKDVQDALNTGWNTNMKDTYSVKTFTAYVTEYINVIDQILQLVGRHENPSKEDYEIIGDGIKYIDDKISQLGDTKQIENFNTELSKYLTTIDIVKTTVEKLNSLKYALSPSVSTTLKDVQDALNTGWNTNMKDTYSVKTFTAYVTEYINVIDQILQLVGRPENPSKEDYERIGDGIKYIDDKISQLRDTKQIENLNKELSKYVTTINTVKTNNVDSITKLIQEINNLSRNFGNLDKFTEAIAEKLTLQLAILSQKIDESSAVIIKAEEIQEERHRKIKEETAALKKLMDKQLTINIQQVSDVSSLSQTPSHSNTGGNTGSNTNNGTTSSGGVDNRAPGGLDTNNTSNQSGKAPEPYSSRGSQNSSTSSRSLVDHGTGVTQTSSQNIKLDDLVNWKWIKDGNQYIPQRR